MTKRIVAREGSKDYTFSQFCSEVHAMLREFNSGFDIRTPLTNRIIDDPDDEFLDELDAEQMIKWCATYDESFYQDRAYLWSCFLYYKMFSAMNVWTFRNAYVVQKLGPFVPRSLFDVGAGLGMTTVNFATMLPDAEIFFSNVPGPQCEFAKSLFARFAPNATVVDQDARPNVDAVAFLDVLEHIREPMPFMRSYISDRTNVILDSSAFGTTGSGHWQAYIDDGVWYPAKPLKRRFTNSIKAQHEQALKNLGFRYFDDVKYGWNKTPRIFVR